MAVRRTRITLDLGTAAHFILGLLSVLFGNLGYTALLATLFLVKQILDLMGGEAYNECSGDIAELSIGIVTGLIVSQYGFNLTRSTP